MLFSRLIGSLRRWRAYRAAYREIASLDSRERDDLDIGLSRIDELVRR
jgi:uncharacterized protein YjiS (DUF1127 family)